MSGKDRKRLYLKNFFYEFLNLIYPSHCKICGKKLRGNELLVCKDCIEKLNYFRLRENLISLDKASNFYSFLIFEDIVKDFIHLFKYYGYVPIGESLVDFLMEKYSFDFLNDYDFYLPVPAHKRKLQERGFNQAELIAEWIFKDKDVKKFSLLKKIKYGISQASLDKEGRIKNIRNSFEIKKGNYKEYEDKRIIVVDDILTSGATFFEIRKTLSPLKFERIDILTIATPRQL